MLFLFSLCTEPDIYGFLNELSRTCARGPSSTCGTGKKNHCEINWHVRDLMHIPENRVNENSEFLCFKGSSGFPILKKGYTNLLCEAVLWMFMQPSHWDASPCSVGVKCASCVYFSSVSIIISRNMLN